MTAAPRRAAVGLGSNEAPDVHLPGAVAALAARFDAPRVSAFYRSAPTGGAGAAFVNGAMTFLTALGWRELRAVLKRLEADHGRQRAAGPPRVTLDLDLVILEGCTVDEDGVVLPAPEIPTTPHLLVPLAEIWPDWVHPLDARSLGELASGAARAHATLEPVHLSDPV